MDKFILELPNIVPPNLCNEIIKGFENSSEKESGFMIYSGIKRSKCNEQLNISDLEKWRDTHTKITNYMRHAFMAYLDNLREQFDFKGKCHTFDRILDITGVEEPGLLVQKIKRGDKFEWHHDGFPGDTTVVQMILYLNTLSLTDGGFTEFVNGRKVRPEVGKILVFPSSWTFPHMGNEVKCESKYICTTILIPEFACLKGA